MTTSRRVLMILAAAALLPCLAQTARADTVAKFTCALTCGGTATTGSGTTTGLVTNDTGLSTDFFIFPFDTVAVPGSTKLWDASGSGVSQVTFETSNGSIDFGNVRIASPVPEPGTIALLGTGLLLCGRLLRRKKEDEEAAA